MIGFEHLSGSREQKVKNACIHHGIYFITRVSGVIFLLQRHAMIEGASATGMSIHRKFRKRTATVRGENEISGGLTPRYKKCTFRDKVHSRHGYDSESNHESTQSHIFFRLSHELV